MDTWAILFDLDDTLVLTSALEMMRQKREWSKIYASFYKTKLPEGTHKFISDISKFGQLGVVTSSPRTYAERLLTFHRLDIPVIIAYRDVKHIKPNPESIIKASQKIKIPIQRCIYVGDRKEDILCANQAGIISVGINWLGLLEIQEAKNR
jgi:phosphoglycolate phosphatase/pyrophosphatase PpaX